MPTTATIFIKKQQSTQNPSAHCPNSPKLGTHLSPRPRWPRPLLAVAGGSAALLGPWRPAPAPGTGAPPPVRAPRRPGEPPPASAWSQRWYACQEKFQKKTYFSHKKIIKVVFLRMSPAIFPWKGLYGGRTGRIYKQRLGFYTLDISCEPFVKLWRFQRFRNWAEIRWDTWFAGSGTVLLLRTVSWNRNFLLCILSRFAEILFVRASLRYVLCNESLVNTEHDSKKSRPTQQLLTIWANE